MLYFRPNTEYEFYYQCSEYSIKSLKRDSAWRCQPSCVAGSLENGIVQRTPLCLSVQDSLASH